MLGKSLQKCEYNHYNHKRGVCCTYLATCQGLEIDLGTAPLGPAALYECLLCIELVQVLRLRAVLADYEILTRCLVAE